jgi:hypothetical protein
VSPLAGLKLPGRLADGGKFQTLTRLGFLARGLLYIVVGVLVIGTGRTEDLTGALDYVRDSEARWLLLVLSLGMATYGLWRLADAALGIENPSHDGKAMRSRAAAALIGAIYLYMAYKAVRLFSADGYEAGGVEAQADTLLDLPGGRLVLGLAALLLAAAGAMQLMASFKCSFLRKLGTAAHWPLIKWIGRAGYAARGVIFLAVSLLIGRAAIDGRSDEAGGMEEALDLLSPPVALAVAGGLMLFGLFSMIEARYRRIHEPHKHDLPDQLREVTG